MRETKDLLDSMKRAGLFITFPSISLNCSLFTVSFASPLPIFTCKLWHPGGLVLKMGSVGSISESLPLAAGWIWSSSQAVFLRNVRNDYPNIAFWLLRDFYLRKTSICWSSLHLRAPAIPFMGGTPASSACVCVCVCEEHTPVHIHTPVSHCHNFSHSETRCCPTTGQTVSSLCSTSMRYHNAPPRP